MLQALTLFMLRPLIRLIASLLDQPTAVVTTILYYSDLLPRNTNLEQIVRHDLIHQDNCLFHFLINLLRCLG
ncbi:hypothetical protein AQUCO_02000216v1 [Aquilegia coerulea]|uniref:Secreted protein n=1 Tax=Aquilegia coerulea TaxID=218851 RepID=A0A2G5DGG6_AQUCA|nr:hypothetical protein AQUCO_02000216v1 [Aquilegia coerulea]